MHTVSHRNWRLRHVRIVLNSPSNAHLKNKNDPFTLRTKLLPGLHDLVTHKSKKKLITVVGQL